MGPRRTRLVLLKGPGAGKVRGCNVSSAFTKDVSLGFNSLVSLSKARAFPAEWPHITPVVARAPHRGVLLSTRSLTTPPCYLLNENQSSLRKGKEERGTINPAPFTQLHSVVY